MSELSPNNKTPYATAAEFNNPLQQYKTDDIYALSLLNPLLANYPYIPFTTSSLRPFCLVHILNDIIVNGRKSIIEFGAGISTILIGRLIKKNSIDATLLSIESDENWVKALEKLLITEHIDDVIKVKYAPLRSTKLALDNNKWYDVATLKALVKGRKFDMVVIDGPAAWNPDKKRARYPAVPFIAANLDGNFSIYLDDAIRKGEREVIKLWEEEYGIHFNITSGSLAYYYSGTFFNTEPFGYHLS